MLRTKLTLSTLVATIVLAGCSTQMTQPTQKDVSATKVEAVKVDSTVFDLGEKNGSSVKLNIGLNKTKSPFGIKAIGPSFVSNVFKDIPGARIELHLNKYPQGTAKDDALNPKIRFEDTPTAAIPLTGSALTNVATTGIPLTFTGLKPNSDYYISARAYVDKPFVSGQFVASVTSGVVTVTQLPPNPLMIEAGDEIQIDPDGAGSMLPKFYRIASVSTQTSFTLEDTALTAPSQDIMMFSRNVTGIGDVGTDATPANEGQAADQYQLGGGTAGSLTSDAEVVNVASATGILSIMGDQASGLGKDVWEMNIQLRKDFNPSVQGNVKVSVGDPDTALELITP